MSGDPTYITSYNGARSLIMKVERDELVEECSKLISSIMSGNNDYENNGTGLWTKTVGVAVSDPLGITAQGVETIQERTRTSSKDLCAYRSTD